MEKRISKVSQLARERCAEYLLTLRTEKEIANYVTFNVGGVRRPNGTWAMVNVLHESAAFHGERSTRLDIQTAAVAFLNGWTAGRSAST